MIYTTEIPHLEQGVRSAVTLGKFDGLHRGHQKLIHCISEKRREDCRAVVSTFDVSPRSYILKVPPKFLLTYEERRELAEERGVDILAECPFTEELMHMEPEQFVKEYLVERLHAEYLAVGPDFRFGHKRKSSNAAEAWKRVRIYCGNCGKGKRWFQRYQQYVYSGRTGKGKYGKSQWAFGIYLFYQR